MTPFLFRKKNINHTKDIETIIDDTFNDVCGGLDRWFRNRGLSAIHDLSADWVPDMDVVEENSVFVITVETAGARKENLGVTVDTSRNLVITGSKTQYYEGKPHVHERFYGEFHRELMLPENTDINKISTTYDNGVLTILVPKIPEQEQKKQVRDIQIN